MSVQRAVVVLSGNPGEESDSETSENQSLMAVEEPKKYDFLTLVAMKESDDERGKEQIPEATNPNSDKVEAGQENLALMAGAGSHDLDDALLDTKVSMNISLSLYHRS